MKIVKEIKRYGLIITSVLMLGACKKMDATYSRFIENGPIIYPGKVDTVFALAGNRRIQLKWKVPFDGNITLYKVFWNFGGDSLTLQGNKPMGNDSVKLFVDNLDEGTYNFAVYTYDKAGRRSVGEKTVAKSYGAVFMSTVYNRQIRTFVKDSKTSTLTVTWVGLDLNCIGTEWTYTKMDGTTGNYYSPLALTTVISNCNVSKPISYRSVYLPEATAVDKFYSQFNSL